MSPREKSNSERINVFFSEEILQSLKHIAQQKGMSVSGLVRMMVCERLTQMEAESVFNFVKEAPNGNYKPYK